MSSDMKEIRVARGRRGRTTPALHLRTQRDQPYGSERRCCEVCGVMIWPERQGDATPRFTDDPSVWRSAPETCSAGRL